MKNNELQLFKIQKVRQRKVFFKPLGDAEANTLESNKTLNEFKELYKVGDAYVLNGGDHKNISNYKKVTSYIVVGQVRKENDKTYFYISSHKAVQKPLMNIAFPLAYHSQKNYISLMRDDTASKFDDGDIVIMFNIGNEKTTSFVLAPKKISSSVKTIYDSMYEQYKKEKEEKAREKEVQNTKEQGLKKFEKLVEVVNSNEKKSIKTRSFTDVSANKKLQEALADLQQQRENKKKNGVLEKLVEVVKAPRRTIEAEKTIAEFKNIATVKLTNEEIQPKIEELQKKMAAKEEEINDTKQQYKNKLMEVEKQFLFDEMNLGSNDVDSKYSGGTKAFTALETEETKKSLQIRQNNEEEYGLENYNQQDESLKGLYRSYKQQQIKNQEIALRQKKLEEQWSTLKLQRDDLHVFESWDECNIQKIVQKYYEDLITQGIEEIDKRNNEKVFEKSTKTEALADLKENNKQQKPEVFEEFRNNKKIVNSFAMINENFKEFKNKKNQLYTSNPASVLKKNKTEKEFVESNQQKIQGALTKKEVEDEIERVNKKFKESRDKK
ncbi:MAG: hypothetical protein AAFO15_02625, partial [Pseudomonadota bacterium]